MSDMTLEEALAAAEVTSHVEDELVTPVNDVLMINPETRLIDVPASEEIFGTYLEHDVTRKYFKCPRIVQDNIDLSICHIFINYVSAKGKEGQYLCEDVEATEDGRYITFSWKLTRNVFDVNKDATIYFAVQAKNTEGGNVFNTRKAQGKSYETVESTEVITDEYADVILQIIARLDNVTEISSEDIAKAVSDYLKENPVEVPETLPNPQKLTIKQGEATIEYDGSGAVTIAIPDGKTERIEKAATDTIVELQPNKLYIFPEMSTLTYTIAKGDANVANEYHFIFRSGQEPCEVVHPSEINVGNLTVEANRIYEISIMESCLAYQSWEMMV